MCGCNKNKIVVSPARVQRELESVSVSAQTEPTEDKTAQKEAARQRPLR